MSKKDFKADVSRRRFLRGVAVTGGAAVFAAGAGTAMASGPAGVEESRDDNAKAGYKETKHIREYYARADF